MTSISRPFSVTLRSGAAPPDLTCPAALSEALERLSQGCGVESHAAVARALADGAAGSFDLKRSRHRPSKTFLCLRSMAWARKSFRCLPVGRFLMPPPVALRATCLPQLRARRYAAPREGGRRVRAPRWYRPAAERLQHERPQGDEPALSPADVDAPLR